MALKFLINRLNKELTSLVLNPPEYIKVRCTNNIMIWVIELKGAKNTVYEGETFYLRFTFGENYPFDPPEVVFIENIPENPHVYRQVLVGAFYNNNILCSNGHVCVSILYSQWTPAQTVESICISLLSMLSSCIKKEWPKDNSNYVKQAFISPQNVVWSFHDDSV
ncbi:hypothetical protein BB558_005347 [Smittium angustum]|uniref:UBC core domain-containing protein n=1 Tax=Smittium angustum TaxID=133377 RepID=A0A2U1J0R5_SMIAN|nr:hypothetical protein BB558_005347 [Smittium angustum]